MIQIEKNNSETFEGPLTSILNVVTIVLKIRDYAKKNKKQADSMEG